jgi:hypothetical protein
MAEFPESTGLDDVNEAGDPGWPGDEGWPGDDHRPGGGRWAGGGHRPGGGGPSGDSRAHGRRFRLLALSAVGLLAVAAGAAATLALMRPSSPAAAPGGPPSIAAPGPVPGGGGLPGGGGTLHLLLAGKVVAIGATSITIKGGSHTMTAAITPSTKISGRAASAAAIKTGDLVSVQITESGGKATAAAIQDPAPIPAGGG